ncbi:ABC transporter permease [Actinoplanes utahensis]|uniref:Permease n=1 Tax=Actinoplanes utahensis TaxID=1869 RepID=A0A0A6UCN7_ACTUT|nr:ABC transporter permease [Actinoplanes utahensis]KHD72059.1 hypothetical protein MB27_42180 [Actinoplanes utahensis]GIF28794.1 hypothetical protein Aut01nite_17800 [Actinoplanes utahensis]
MFALVIGAVRARAAQVLTILVLTLLASAVAVAAPWYGFAAVGTSAQAYLDVATAGQRTISVANRVDLQDDPAARLRRFTSEVREELPAGIGDGVTGMMWPLRVQTGAAFTTLPVAYRDDFCAHVRLDGACPAARGEIALSRRAAERAGVGIGGSLTTLGDGSDGPIRLRVVGLYTLTDPAGTYWHNRMFRGETSLDPAFTTVATFTHWELRTPNMAYDVDVPAALLRGDGGLDLGTEITDADRRLGRAQNRLTTEAVSLHQAIVRDRATILNGVLTSGAQLLILTLFAIGLAGWYTLRDRRADAALLKLRGISRFGRLRLAWGQHLVPLTAGALVGVPAGYLLARALAGPVPVVPDRESALTQSVLAVGAVLLGGLAVLAAVEAAVLGRPVSALLQRTPTTGGAWRPALIDMLLIAVAVAAIYQARSGRPSDGLGPAAPALIALTVALVTARLLSRAADRGGGAALRSGRLRTGLTALRISRSPGTDRVFALVVVAVAMFVTAAGGWGAETDARLARSGAELGAVRVLTVEAANRTALLHAVHSADPGGREAMAAVRNRADVLDVLEVDTARLTAVTSWRPEYGPPAALPDAVAGAARPPLPLVTGDRLTLRAQRAGRSDVALWLRLQHESTGEAVTAGFGTLRPGDQTITVPVAGCATAPGCRIVRWEMTSPPDADGRFRPPPDGASITVSGLGQGGSESGLLDAATLGDIRRWRAGTVGAALDLSTADGRLRLATDPNENRRGPVGVQAWASDSLLPLPALLAGPLPDDWREADPALDTYGEPVPLRVAATVGALPLIGRGGLMIDLDTARRVAAEAESTGQYQVWLAPGARPGIVADLTAAGLTVTADSTVAAHAARLGAQGPAVVVRFALLAGVAALLLAAATVAVAASVDRRSLTDQFAALRAQGLPRRVAITTGYAGAAALIVAGLLGGILAAVLAVALIGRTVPLFADGWAVLEPPAPLNPGTTALAVLAACAVLGLTAWAALLPLLRGLRDSTPTGRAESGR